MQKKRTVGKSSNIGIFATVIVTKLEFCAHKKFAILGMGKTGIAVLRALLGVGSKIVVFEDELAKREVLRQNPEYQSALQKKQLSFLSTNDEIDLEKECLDGIVVSPGVATQGQKEHPLIKRAKALKIALLSDIDLLYQSNPKAKYIGITGTNGKSTTTALIHHCLDAITGRSIQMGGNIGVPALDLITDADVYVLELSSYQLDLLNFLQLDVAIYLNIASDHLERYGTIANYADSKGSIFESFRSSDKYSSNKLRVGVISVDYELTRSIYERLKGCAPERSLVPFSVKDQLEVGISIVNNVLHIRDIFGVNAFQKDLAGILPHALGGRHNAENLAATIAGCLAIEPNIELGRLLEVVGTFNGLLHRMQIIPTKATEITFINDSKATNAASTRYALELYSSIHWIVGGLAKDEGIEALADLFHKIKCAYLVGDSMKVFARVLDAYGVPYVECRTLEKALLHIRRHIATGIVMLSPACASLDQWNNFEERGDFFIKCVQMLWGR